LAVWIAVVSLDEDVSFSSRAGGEGCEVSFEFLFVVKEGDLVWRGSWVSLGGSDGNGELTREGALGDLVGVGDAIVVLGEEDADILSWAREDDHLSQVISGSEFNIESEGGTSNDGEGALWANDSLGDIKWVVRSVGTDRVWSEGPRSLIDINSVAEFDVVEVSGDEFSPKNIRVSSLRTLERLV
jgi:hypothetical protein